MQCPRATGHRSPIPQALRRAIFFISLLGLTLLLFSSAATAFAGRASTGELAFYPCTNCHPVTVDASGNPTKPLPNGMKKHEIELQAHDILGKTPEAACLACHDDPSRNPGMLKLADGSLIDIKGDVSQVCQRCHFEKYREFRAGIHGKHAEKCTSAGCHNPHTPQWIYVEKLPPFQGTGFEVKAVGFEREPFKPFASPPVPPEVTTPTYLYVAFGLGLIIILALVGYLTLGRSKQ